MEMFTAAGRNLEPQKARSKKGATTVSSATNGVSVAVVLEDGAELSPRHWWMYLSGNQPKFLLVAVDCCLSEFAWWTICRLGFISILSTDDSHLHKANSWQLCCVSQQIALADRFKTLSISFPWSILSQTPFVYSFVKLGLGKSFA